MFIKIDESITINISLIKKFWATHRDSGQGILVFEFLNGAREIMKFENLAKAKEMEHNVQGFLDRKFTDFNS